MSYNNAGHLISSTMMVAIETEMLRYL